MMSEYSNIAYICVPLLALLLDTLIGDPRSNWHPVVLMGKVISFYENIFYYRRDRHTKQLFFGFLTAVCSLFTVVVIAYFFWILFGSIHQWGEVFIETVLLYICISPRSLAGAGIEIAGYLKRHDINNARFKVGWIVGRDTAHLDEGEVARATVETIAENTTDGIIAPLFYFAIFGPMGAIFYRMSNTLDSMLGYKNEKYLYFGRFAAKWDDVMNYIPARITFLLFILTSFILRKDTKRAWYTTLRDASKHPSPNGGYAEAPIAGALRIRLGGNNVYGGIPHFRAYMGDPLVPLRGYHIMLTIGIMYVTTIIATILTTGVHYWLLRS